MKKILLSLTTLGFVGLGTAQTVLFEDSFETYTDFAIENVGDWTLVDVDELPTYGFTGVSFENTGVAKSFQVFNSTATDPALEPSDTSDWTGHTGEKGMVCFAAAPAAGVYNDDWLISPQIELGSTNTISFWYKACSASYSAEQFTVSVSTTDTAPGSFTVISDNPISILSGDITWHEFSFTLPSEYDGESVYVGIHCTSQDQFGFMVDDFEVSAQSMATSDVNAALNISSVYPNPATDMVNVKLAEDFDATKTSVRIYSMTGKKAVDYKYNATLDVSNLAKGVYVMEITDGNKTESKKLIIK